MRTSSLPLLIALIHLLAGLASCGSTRGHVLSNDSVVLAEREESEDERVVYRLVPDEGGSPTIQRTRETTREEPVLGVWAESIDESRAERLGLTPWRGARVTRVARGSAAAEAGIREGDVVLAVGGIEITSDGQLTDVVRSRTEPGEEVEVRLLRTLSAKAFEDEPTLVAVTPEAREVHESDTEIFPLEAPRDVERRTGIQAATVPPELAEEVFGERVPAAVVAGTVVGSPGYHAGLRGGDRILSCNGRPIDSVDALAAAARAGERFELAVDGPLGPHDARVEVVDDVYASSRFHIPFVIGVRSSADYASTSFLDVIFQLGFNHRRRWLASETREPRKWSYLSIFPLGMFEFERHPDERRYRFFWLIRFESES